MQSHCKICCFFSQIPNQYSWKCQHIVPRCIIKWINLSRERCQDLTCTNMGTFKVGFFFSLSWLQSAIHPTYGSWVSHLSVVFVPQKENLCTYQSMCGVHLIYGSNSTFLYTAFSYSLLAVKTSACLSVYINAQWMNMTSHFFLMSPSSVCNKSSE